jgi:hypothetical protein
MLFAACEDTVDARIRHVADAEAVDVAAYHASCSS